MGQMPQQLNPDSTRGSPVSERKDRNHLAWGTKDQREAQASSCPASDLTQQDREGLKCLCNLPPKSPIPPRPEWQLVWGAPASITWRQSEPRTCPDCGDTKWRWRRKRRSTGAVSTFSPGCECGVGRGVLGRPTAQRTLGSRSWSLCGA
ncbi:uncharacterized protein LOC101789071 isoform X4 [Cavia porcellus]|uniref:uncharacterized protein LOC101789071 isoform X4 n=1 Tax=Cavia porcellus TaxID=10141 RepID=UPI002FDFBF72